MQNVDALYDVLVRLTMAADLAEKKPAAALLDSALDRLESARKAATGQLVQAAALQNQQLVQLQARMQENAADENVSGLPMRRPSWWTMSTWSGNPSIEPSIIEKPCAFAGRHEVPAPIQANHR